MVLYSSFVIFGSVFDSSCSLSNLLLNKQSLAVLFSWCRFRLVGMRTLRFRQCEHDPNDPVCQLTRRERWTQYCFPSFNTKHAFSDAGTNFAYILTPCMTEFASRTYGSNWRSYSPLPRLPQQDHKLKNQLHVSKAEVDNLCITAKSHWFGESGVALSAARRLPWPGRYEPTLYCRAVNEVCGESGWQPVWCKYWKELVAE